MQLPVTAYERSHPMQVTTIGLDLAKNVFQVHGIDENGEVVEDLLPSLKVSSLLWHVCIWYL